MKKFLVRLLLVMIVTSLALTSCKAWRTISTTATCTQLSDSTKTIEEYQGVKKN